MYDEIIKLRMTAARLDILIASARVQRMARPCRMRMTTIGESAGMWRRVDCYDDGEEDGRRRMRRRRRQLP